MPLLVRAARLRNVTFLITLNVLIMDLIKLFFCAMILSMNEWSVFKFIQSVKCAVFGDLIETAKVCLPSIIYMVQNNLYYVALSNLEPTTFLVIGAGIVQSEYQPPPMPPSHTKTVQNPLIGFIVVITMCCTSAFAGAYLEMVLKKSQVTVWMQNIRMSLFSCLISLAVVLVKDGEQIKKDGFFVGYDILVWIMTINNSIGGLVIAVVIKYADNIMKAYAQAIAILGASIGSWVFFNFVPSPFFLFGMLIVIVSVCLYNWPTAANASKTAIELVDQNPLYIQLCNNSPTTEDIKEEHKKKIKTKE